MIQRSPFDFDSYIQQIQSRPCFICDMVAGRLNGNHVIYQNDQVILFLNKYPTVYGYTLLAPVEHREQVTGDFSQEEFLALQRWIYLAAEAVRKVVPAERIYILSLGSQQGNRHVHWHIAPLPPGVPFKQQQLDALSLVNGYIELPEGEMADLTDRIGKELARAAS